MLLSLAVAINLALRYGNRWEIFSDLNPWLVLERLLE
jgi:hypothetical protein